MQTIIVVVAEWSQLYAAYIPSSLLCHTYFTFTIAPYRRLDAIILISLTTKKILMKKKTAVLKTIKKFHSISFYNLVKKKY